MSGILLGSVWAIVVCKPLAGTIHSGLRIPIPFRIDAGCHESNLLEHELNPLNHESNHPKDKLDLLRDGSDLLKDELDLTQP
jgi:hypothetical protein